MNEQEAYDLCYMEDTTRVDIQSEPTPFGYDKVYIAEFINERLGYKVIRTYTWEDMFNDQGVFVGSNVILQVDEAIKLGGDE